MSGRPAEPGRTLLAVARDLARVTDEHAPALRREGLDDVAERLEDLVLSVQSGAQELAAALEPPQGGPQVSPEKATG